jgi:cytochrome d ubiquinol oxidase subunit II
MLVGQLTIADADADGAGATLRGLLLVMALAAVIVLPSLGYLLRLTQTQAWSRI